MLSSLTRARKFADNLRYIDDKLSGDCAVVPSGGDRLKDLFYSEELSISKELTPQLFSSLLKVLIRLEIPKEAVDAFVYASYEINAQCYTGSNSQCIIRFSSQLIEILSADEFEFVVGHELGHFLLSHAMISQEYQSGTLEFFMQQRAQEISADRLGLLACRSLDVATKALIKTVSGLSDRHLRFDVGSFLSQLKKVSNKSSHHQSTHPSILVRCRALLWFSLNGSYMNRPKDYCSRSLAELDKRIQIDFEKFVDGSARQRIDDAKRNLAMWMTAYDIVQKGQFSKADQNQFKKIFDKDTLLKLKSFLSALTADETERVVFEKIEEARGELESLIPTNFENEIASIQRWNSII